LDSFLEFFLECFLDFFPSWNDPGFFFLPGMLHGFFFLAGMILDFFFFLENPGKKKIFFNLKKQNKNYSLFNQVTVLIQAIL
jgi:hypothetical protein